MKGAKGGLAVIAGRPSAGMIYVVAAIMASTRFLHRYGRQACMGGGLLEGTVVLSHVALLTNPPPATLLGAAHLHLGCWGGGTVR